MELSRKFTQSGDVISREVGGEVVLLHLASGTYFGINAVGVKVWSYFAGRSRSLTEICDMLEKHFEVSRVNVERDVIALTRDLVEHGLLVSQ